MQQENVGGNPAGRLLLSGSGGGGKGTRSLHGDDQNTHQHFTTLSLTDIILVNNSYMYRVVNKGVIHLPLSDHSLVYCTIKAGVAEVAPANY